MSWLKKFGAMVKEYPVHIAVVVVLSVVFLGGAILGVYNKVRAKVPSLPAPK